MTILIALDSFKGSLSASRACARAAEGFRAAQPGAEVVELPVADGGEGTAEAMRVARNGQWVRLDVTGPLPEMCIRAGFVQWDDGRTALVEMAVASGLPLLKPGQYNPLRATTFGTGELLQAAARGGAERVYLAVGGSATVDGGVGAAQALGWQFLDRQGRNVEPGGAALEHIDRIQPPRPWVFPPVEVLCDVQNPLLGPEGAAAVYGPQKGADPAAVERLEAGLAHLAELVRRDVGVDMNIAGGGAAGGLAAGAHAFLGARLVPGIETVMTAVGLDEQLSRARFVVTGEGRFDRQSLYGKVVAGVSARAATAGVPVLVLAGQVDLNPEAWRRAGITDVEASRRPGMPLEQALAEAGPLLQDAAQRLGERILFGTQGFPAPASGTSHTQR